MAAAKATLQTAAARAAFWMTFGSAVAVLFSIAVSHILLALALAALLISGEKLRLPPVKAPLALFLAGTLLSLALSSDPGAGRPQVRKIFVYLMLLVIASTFRELRQARWLVLAWVGVASLSSLKSLFQFWQKLDQSRRLGVNFYTYYVSERTTGFMSHWMTFGGEMTIVFLLGLSFLLFARRDKRPAVALLAGLGVIGLGVVAGFTRSIWLASGAGAIYLAWYWKRWVAALVPAAVLLAIALGPNSVRERFTSILRPRVEVDSNQHRIITWRTGLRMIRAHPWVGLGPEMVNLRFMEFVPPDVPRPLPTGWYGHLHNIYLHYAAERGIPTMLALMWMLFKMTWDFLRALRRLPPGAGDERFLLHGCVAVMISILITGVFELNLGDSEVLLMFLAAMGCGYTAVEARTDA